MFFQGLFNRVDTHVVVKDHLLGSSNFKVGDIIKPGDWSIYHVRNLFRRKIIGKLDSPWANEVLGRLEVKAEKKEVKKEPKKPVKKPKKAVDKSVDK